jgi:hypothetical protein
MGAWIGMLVLETVAKIRRAYFVQRKTIKAICRELRVSRKVVRRVLRSDATEFRYERSEQPLPRIGPWQDALDGMLASNEAKPVRERLTLIRVFEALRELGYEGGYDAVRRYARVWQRDRAATSVGAFIPLSFAPRVIQVLLGHAKLDNTAFYTKVATRTVRTVTSPLDKLGMFRAPERTREVAPTG